MRCGTLWSGWSWPCWPAGSRAARCPRRPGPPGTDLIPQIRHIVVLMMENHSYDNYLGMLRGRGEGIPLGPDGNPDATSTSSGGEVVQAHRMPSTVQQPDVPSQSWHASHLQWGEGRCDGFVTATQTALSEAGASRYPGTAGHRAARAAA